MGYSKYVGRVGALAVALGIGTAVANPAWAETPNTESKTSAESVSVSPPSTDPDPADPPTDDTAPDPEPEPEEVDGDEETPPALDDTEEDLDGEVVVVEPDIEDDDESVLENAGDTNESEDLEETGGGDGPPPSAEPVVEVRADVRQESAPAEPPLDESVPPPADDVSLRSAISETDSSPSLLMTTEVAPPAPSATITVTSVKPAPASSPVRTFVVGLLRALGYNPLADAPTPSGGLTPLLELIWASYRRIEPSLINVAPTVGTPEILTTELVGGQIKVTGRLNFTDFNNDPMTYTATNGVTVDSAGVFTYLYTPDDPDLPTQFSFAITAKDKSSFRLFDVLNLFKPGGGHTTTAGVTVSVQPLVNLAPVVGDPGYTITDEDEASGRVTGLLHVTDPNNDPLTYSAVSVDPALGQVTFVGSGFIFRPTYGARLAVFNGTGPSNAQFSVDVSDGEFTVNVPVSVAIEAAQYGVSDTYPVGTAAAGIAVSADGTRVYVANSANLTVTAYDAITMAKVDARPLLPGVNPFEVGPNPSEMIVNGDRLYVANTGSYNGHGTVSVLDTTTGSEVARVIVGNGPGWLTLNGTRLYVTNTQDNTISVIDTATNTVIGAPIAVAESAHPIAASATRLYVPNTTTNKVTVYDTATFDVVAEISAGTDPWNVALHNSRLYIADVTDDTVTVFDTATDTVVGTIDVGHGAIAMAAHGERLYISNTFDNTVSIIDTATNTVIETVGVGTLPGSIAISPDGSRVYVLNGGDSTVSVITALVPAPANHAPVAHNGTLQNATENGTTTASLANLVTDADGDAVTLEVVTAPAVGTVTFLTATNFRFVAPPEIGAVTSTTFTYRAFDGTSYSNTATVTINFINSNDAPVAADDLLEIAEDSATVDIDVLGNDTDPEGDTLHIATVGTPDHGGTAVINLDGTIGYTPAPDFFGTETFSYTVSDGSLTDTATVTVTVDPVDDAASLERVTAALSDLGTGAVTITIVVRNPMSDSVTITVDPQSPGGGEVSPLSVPTYDPDTQTFSYTATYTPTQAARLRAATNSGAATSNTEIDVALRDELGSVVDSAMIEVPIAAAAFTFATATDASGGYTPMSRRSVALSPDGTIAYVTDGNHITFVDLASGHILRRITPMGEAFYEGNSIGWYGVGADNIVVSPHTGMIYVTGQSCSCGHGLSVVSPDGSPEAWIRPPSNFNGFALSPDGQQVYATYLHYPLPGSSLDVVSTDDNSVVEIALDDNFSLHAVTPDGSKIIGTQWNSAGRVFGIAAISTTDQTVSTFIPLPYTSIGAVKVSPDAGHVFTIANQTLLIIDMHTGEITTAAFGYETGYPQVLATSPDGSLLYITQYGPNGQELSVRASATGEQLAEIAVQARGLTTSPDGRTVYVVGADQAAISVFSFGATVAV